MIENIFHVLALGQREIMLFALAGLLIGGIDDLAFDLFYWGRTGWRSLFVYTRHSRMTIEQLPASPRSGKLAIFIPAWAEADVIGAMLRRTTSVWEAQACRLFVGTYPNDPSTIRAVLEVTREAYQVHLVVLPHDGPTTKADCLNHLWHAMQRDEAARGVRYKGIVLHDAEDVVHADEPRLFDAMLDRFTMVQLPVRPLLNQQSQWIAGHYADEFAESHGKAMRTREALGAGIPSAGVGCAFERDALGQIAEQRGGQPFDPRSLTEDYEIGLRLRENGGRTAFVAMEDAQGALICTQEHFPETLPAAVRQKGRWFAGIALAGWDRLGWSGSWRERWMRLHDRRTMLSALVLLATYAATLGYAVLTLASQWGIRAAAMPLDPVTAWALACTGTLMSWRLTMRCIFTTRAYGWRQGLRSIPRCIVGNIIALLAARHAVDLYRKQMRDGKVLWNKTAHRFPEMPPLSKAES